MQFYLTYCDDYRELKTREMGLRTEVSQVKAECNGLNKRVKNTDEECLQLREQLHVKVRFKLSFST